MDFCKLEASLVTQKEKMDRRWVHVTFDFHKVNSPLGDQAIYRTG